MLTLVHTFPINYLKLALQSKLQSIGDCILEISIQKWQSVRCSKDCPDVALDAVVGLCQGLTPVNRGVVVRTLAQMQLNEETSNSNQGW